MDTTQDKAQSNLDQRIIMVTGASSGLGQQVAIQAGAQGASIIALGRSEDGLEHTRERIEASGGRCLYVPFDLLKFEDYGKLFLALKDQIPHLDGLVHCAGSLDRCVPMQYIKVNDFRKMLDIHLTAPNMLTQSMLPLLRRAESASVIFTTCDMINEDQNNWHAYGFAKRAMNYVASMWQGEHPDKPYRFNTINPGRVRTELFRRAFAGLLATKIPLPAEVVPAYLHLLSDDSKDMRGQHLDARAWLGLSCDI
ncbi:MAG: short-chain dehydrogenase [Zetaproteobacteria bacterium CG_4_9_14_3_um_filter_49_83]|nr:MAG: short-chain dehydrogenase [Zetaproteobacteria bacterium CG1_02_49_23]PIQ33026.1 MAG: short-chain dehydrogenase [Zetaproteobacteria bacterium CG17_big_fil_post_rev_8_21_14_2_50_50_13]PIV31213.1 MAG: short-chain dehydrogenase [Zetaproteobacteria bacterium CG02_land_8_20_14_3_00_50_9]PIY55183.1 MAG: short-chain dehydrogenase [Zetaproteobacteria bacterium CG_4_10_14_0_8_um_filter_49_80]PJA35552.1 MAG: short-chain dehydrogenase [Zetaproteobacteria bacterium CG_4_9_14_3_um_filter_49_83]